MKPLNSGHLRVLKNLSVIERYPLLGVNLKKIVTFGTKRFVRYSRHVHYLGCRLLGGFTVIQKWFSLTIKSLPYTCVYWFLPVQPSNDENWMPKNLLERFIIFKDKGFDLHRIIIWLTSDINNSICQAVWS